MLELNNISFSYPSGTNVIKKLSLSVASGESVGLVGCNGAGKSTLLSLICGLNFVDQGEIIVNNIAVKKETLPEIRKAVGMVFQNPDDQLFMPNILEDVMFGPCNYGLNPDLAREKAEKALDAMSIPDLAERPPYRLSGGERRSAAIATVMVMEPSLILLDEPTAFLDPRSVKNFEAMVNKLDIAYLIASHDLDLILNTCRRVIIMDNGSIVADGEPELLLKDEKLLFEAGLELPASFYRCKTCMHQYKKQS
ncbi:MAG: ABC transporter ATP-binding protein [Bacillota bacterium]|nr:ABC transporter ATP-binding protein [Bacillota bacterium]